MQGAGRLVTSVLVGPSRTTSRGGSSGWSESATWVTSAIRCGCACRKARCCCGASVRGSAVGCPAEMGEVAGAWPGTKEASSSRSASMGASGRLHLPYDHMRVSGRGFWQSLRTTVRIFAPPSVGLDPCASAGVLLGLLT